jgi:tetratricopeptide (TPR) repeat protein
MWNKSKLPLWAGVAFLAASGAAALWLWRPHPDYWLALERAGTYAAVEIQHPIEGAVLPLNMPAPVLLWRTNPPGADHWVAAFKAGGQKWLFDDIQPMWRPPEARWRAIKQAAKAQPIELLLGGCRRDQPGQMLARGSVHFALAQRAVQHPLFYREVNLPFSDAVKDPSNIRWRFGGLDKGTLPPVVLEKLPVCGNCHSFSRKGEYLAMDVDYANSKASYIITRTAPQMRLATSDIITWDDYRREDGQQTFGLLSQISPDGRYVLSTVKDRSVFIARPDLAFSQLFFPLQGILAVYDRETKAFSSLPGADDPALVQSNPTWSPDGQSVVFARTRAVHLQKTRDTASILLTTEEIEEFLKQGKEFHYDLYRLPFNGGKGGQAEPVKGASANGRSNYFPKFSPDGRWIVFCQASNYMLLQPDSQLFIIPAQGGEAGRLGCNLGRMNSWHTWSPDGHWLVFSSKAHSDYTQLYLTSITEQGEASPPVWLAHMVAPGRAANIPEFVALGPEAIVKIREQFLDDFSFTRAATQLMRAGDADPAIQKFRTALELNPNNATAHQRLGFLLFHAKNQTREALEQSQAAVRLEPHNAFAQHDLGLELAASGDLSNAVPHLAEAIRLLPNGFDRQYSVVNMNYALAEAYYQLKLYAQSVPVLETVLRHNARHPQANYVMAMARAWLGETDATSPYFDAAVRSEPHLGQMPDYYDLLSRNYADLGRFAEGLRLSQKAYQLAVAAGRSAQAAALQERAEYCRRRQ